MVAMMVLMIAALVAFEPGLHMGPMMPTAHPMRGHSHTIMRAPGKTSRALGKITSS